MLDLDRVKIIKEMVEGVAKRHLPRQSFADLRVFVPAPVLGIPGHLGVIFEGAKRFGEDDYVIRAAFSLSPVEQADNDAVIKKAYLAAESVNQNVFIEVRSDRLVQPRDDSNHIVFKPKATARI